MNQPIARGRCPVCSTRLTLVQLVLTPKTRVFECRRCGTKLQKVSNRMGPALMWVAAYSLTSSRFGMFSWEAVLVLLAAFTHLYLDALFIAKVKLADSGSAASPAE